MTEKWKLEFAESFAPELEKLKTYQEDGLVELQSNRLSLTPLGRFFMRNVAMNFDTYLTSHLGSGKKIFSQTV